MRARFISFSLIIAIILSCSSSRSGNNNNNEVKESSKDSTPSDSGKPKDQEPANGPSDPDEKQETEPEDPKTCQSATDMSVDCIEERRRTVFLSEKVHLAKNKVNTFIGKVDVYTALINTEMSAHYANDGGLMPKTILLMDYPASGASLFKESTLVIKFESSFEKKLPRDLRKVLSKYRLDRGDRVDIFLNIQSNEFLGEEEDYAGVPSTTRLKAHAWVDPDAPAQYTGTRVNRPLEIGIFDSDNDISDEVPMGTLKAFSVQTHDSVFSPRTARVKVSKNSPSQSFWTLAIDSKNPHKVQANATLHWSLTREDDQALLGVLYASAPSGYGRLDIDYNTFNVNNLGDFVTKVSANPKFKDKAMLQKLKALLN